MRLIGGGLRTYRRTVAVEQNAAQKIVAHIHAKWTNGCPMCGSRAWELGGFVNLPIAETLNPAEILLGGPALPSTVVVCKNCGNTVFINLIVAGMVAKDG